MSLMSKFWVVLVLLWATAPFALLGTTPDELNATQPHRMAVWVIIYIAFSFFCLQHTRELRAAFANGRLVLAATLLAMLSAIWSLGPVATLSASMALWGTTLIAFYMAATVPPLLLLKLLATSLGLLAVGSAFTIMLLPEYGLMHGTHEGLWNGLTTHKNALGRYMMVGFVAALAVAGQAGGMQRLLWLALAGLCFILITGTGSATAIILLGVFILFYALLRLSARLSPALRAALLVVCLGLASAAGLLLSDPGSLEEALLSLGRDPTLTHRTRIWAIAFDAIAEHPWLGYGYEVFWNSAFGNSLALHHTDWGVPHVHNGFLELWLAMGIGGLLLALALVVQLLLKIHQRMSSEMQVLFALVLATGLVLNLVEFSLLRYNNLFWILFVYVLVRLNAAARTA